MAYVETNSSHDHGTTMSVIAQPLDMKSPGFEPHTLNSPRHSTWELLRTGNLDAGGLKFATFGYASKNHGPPPKWRFAFGIAV